MCKSVTCVLFSLAVYAVLLCPDVVPYASAQDGHAAETAHGESNGGEHHPQGVPLDFKTDLAIWSLVTFIVFVLVLRKFAWGPLIAGLDNREAQMQQHLVDAETARQKAEQMLADYGQKLEKVQDEVREILAEARRDAEHTKNEIVAEAQREAGATVQRATEDIQRATEQTKKELFDYLATHVANATETVLERALTDADQERFIQEALTQIGEQ